jgi:catalase
MFMAKQTKRDVGETVKIHDQQLHRGNGGELHQVAEDGTPVLTTAQGGPVVGRPEHACASANAARR